MQLADIFGGDIDFHRDLRRNDRFSVVYEMSYLQGRAVRAGRVLAAEFVNGGKSFRAPNYAGAYYTPDGKNLRKAFLRSPLEFSRISSGFALRMHPILREWRAHRGIDYAAPTGTQVRATGDGVVEFAGRQGGYGNVVILRHHGQYRTLYAHLNGFAKGLRKGPGLPRVRRSARSARPAGRRDRTCITSSLWPACSATRSPSRFPRRSRWRRTRWTRFGATRPRSSRSSTTSPSATSPPSNRQGGAKLHRPHVGHQPRRGRCGAGGFRRRQDIDSRRPPCRLRSRPARCACSTDPPGRRRDRPRSRSRQPARRCLCRCRVARVGTSRNIRNRRARNRLPRPNGAPPAGTRLHAADRQCRAARRTHRDRGRRGLPKPRYRRGRPGRAAGSRVSRPRVFRA